MSISRKDHLALAQALADSCPGVIETGDFDASEADLASYQQWRADVEAIINVLDADPNFNRDKFLLSLLQETYS